MSTRRGFLLRTGALLAVGGAVWWRRDALLRPAPQLSGPASSDWLAFQAPGAAPVVEVQLHGRTVRALVDSGAQASALDAAFAASLPDLADFPLPIIAYGAGGQAVAGRAAQIEVTAGGVTARGLRAAVLDLGLLAREDGLNAPLVLGQDLLTALAAQIDYAHRRLRLHVAETYTPPPGAVALPTRRQGRALYADVTVEQATVAMMVDTGASAALSLKAEVAEAAGLLDGRPSRRGQALALGGVVEGTIVRAAHARLGPESFDGAEVHIVPAAAEAATPLARFGVAAPRLPDGLLGSGAFRRAHVVLDLSRGALHRLPPTGPRPLDVRTIRRARSR